MKTCPEITIKQCVYSEIHFGHPVEIWTSKSEIPIKTWILFDVYKCLYTVYKFHIIFVHKMYTNRQLCKYEIQ